MVYSYEDYLEHFGVKGMKWGIRKEERKTSNIPGGKVSSNSKGKVKGVELSAKSKKSATTPSKDKVKASLTEKKIKEGSLDAISNKELQDLISRKNLEQQYSTIMTKESQKGIAGYGRKIAQELMMDYAKQTARTTFKEAGKVGQTAFRNYVRSNHASKG